MTRATASSSHDGTPSVRDVRRARAARFSTSPAQDFGSPSFSLGLEKFPQPPIYDDCWEEDRLKSDEKESSKRIRLLNDEAAPSFSLGLEEIQAPPTSTNCKEKDTLDRSRQALKQRQGQETREVQQLLYPSGGDYTFPPVKSNGCPGTDPLKTAEEPRNNQGRAFKVFSGPSFSIGVDRISSPPKSDDASSRKETQASDCTRAHADSSIYPSSSYLMGEHPSSSKSRLSQISSVDHREVLESTLLQVSPGENSASPKCESTLKLSGEVTSKHRTLQGNFPPPSASLFERKIKRSSSPSVKSCDEQATKQIRLFEGLAPPPRLTGHVGNEPTSDADVTRRDDDQRFLRKRLGSENASPSTKKIRPTSRSELSSRSHGAQIFERIPNKGGHSRSQKFKAADSTMDAMTVSPNHRVGLIPKTEEVQVCEGKIGESLPPSFSHSYCPPLIDLSQEREEKAALGQLKRRHGISKDSQNPRGYKIPVEYVEDSKVNDQRTEKDKVDVVDVSTPPSLRLASKRPHRDSYGCSESEIVQDSEDELGTDLNNKRRRMFKPCTRSKAKLPSTHCLEDLTCPPVDSTSAADERTLGTPTAEQKIFKRLRRGSSCASKDSAVNQAPQDSIDRYVALKLEPREPSLNLNKQVQTSVIDSKEQTTDSPQRTTQDEFDDIEDFREYEVASTGSRPHRDGRYLQSQIEPKKLSLSTLSPAGVMKPVLHIPGLDTPVVSKKLGKAKAESVTCLKTKISPSNIAKTLGNVKAEPITLSDDEELWRSKVFCSQTLNPKVFKASTSIFQKQKPVPDHDRTGASFDVLERGSSLKGKYPIMDGSDLWKSYTEDFSHDGDAGPGDGFAGASNNLYKTCQSEGVKIADLLRERLPNFKIIDALLLDGGLDQEPVYIDYRNQFGRSQHMDSAAFAELDCSQPQSRRKGKRSSSNSTKGRNACASSSATNSSQRTSASKSPAKRKRKAWTLFRETQGRASASALTSGKGYWIVENGRRVYVKDGRTLTGRSAYAAYKKDSGKKSRKTRKKFGSKAKR